MDYLKVNTSANERQTYGKIEVKRSQRDDKRFDFDFNKS